MARRNGAVPEPKTETLSREQVLRRIDRQARRSLGIPGAEFLRRFHAGELEHSPEELRIEMLAELVP